MKETMASVVGGLVITAVADTVICAIYYDSCCRRDGVDPFWTRWRKAFRERTDGIQKPFRKYAEVSKEGGAE